MKFAGLILAAGESRRMGRPKALLPAPGGPQTFADRLVATLSSRCAPVIIVLGHDAATIRRGISSNATFVINENYALGQLSSLQCGLRAVPESADAFLFTPVDQPSIRAATIAALADTFEQTGALIVLPRHAGRRGHPVCCSRRLIPEFLALAADATARDVIDRYETETAYVDVDDPGTIEDVDDPAAYSRLLETAARR